jgi:hypothetical protein
MSDRIECARCQGPVANPEIVRLGGHSEEERHMHDTAMAIFDQLWLGKPL